MTSSFIDIPFLDNESSGNTSSQPCGLFSLGADAKQVPVPLKSRTIKADVFAEHSFTEIVENHTYIADEDISAQFIFPLPPRSAVFRFKATIGDREVVTEVKRKQEAQAEFDAAVRQGHTAIKLEQGKGSQLYKVNIGNLVSMEECIISFSYIRILNSVAGSVEFEHSATWVPPYIRGSTPSLRPLPLLAPLGDQGVPLNPTPVNLQPSDGNPDFSLSPVSYKLSYEVRVRSSRGFTSIECPTASTPIQVTEEEGGLVRTVRLNEAVSDPSKDFTLLVELPPLGKGGENGGLLVQECTRNGKKKQVALATFCPPPPPPSTLAAPPLNEIIFIIDGSGSMSGSPIAQALEASLYFVKDLPVDSGISINVAVFGSSYSMMWPKSKHYNEASQKEAVQWIQSNVNSDYGGTEVLSVLQAVYSQPLELNTTRQIIFLTDGGVDGNEESRIFELIEGKSEAASKTSIFSLGIGHGVHRGLVEGVAKKSGGVAQFVVDGEPLAKKIGMLKKCALSVSGGCYSHPRLVSRSALIRSAPHILPPRLFPGESFSVLAEIIKSDPSASLDLLYALQDGKSTSPCPHPSPSLALNKAVHLPDGDALSVLHAMACVGSLLSGTSELHVSSDGTPLPSQPQQQEVEDAVVLLAISEGLVTPHTSAVGVLLQNDPLDPSKVKKVEVPLQVPAGRKLWETQSSQGDIFGAVGGGGGPVLAGAVRCCAAPPPRMMMKKCAAPRMMMAAPAPPPPPGNSSGFGSAIGGLFGSIASAFSGSSAQAPPPPPLPPPPAFAYSMPAPAPMMSAPAEAALDLMDMVGDADDQIVEKGCLLGEPAMEEEHTVATLSTAQVLSMLNLKRTVNGSIPPDPAVMEAIAREGWKTSGSSLSLSEYTKSKLVESIPQALAASPHGSEVWATVLGLAWLRKHAGGEKEVWAGLEAKAVAWLGSIWAASGMTGSVGGAILGTMKLV